MQSKQEIIEEHLKDIFEQLGIQPTPSNIDTPKRIAKMWLNEVCKNDNFRGIEELNNSIKLFDNPEEEGEEMIVMKGIKFSSFCEHHFLPFSGTIDVGYIPSKKVIGLSKIPRIVKYFSKKPQLQEKLGKEIADYLAKVSCAKAVVVRITSTHGCVMCRGIESDCETVTYSISTPRNEYKDMREYRRRLVDQLNSSL